MNYTIDIDTGGTFTDGFFVLGDRVETVKVPTTPHDLTVCFLECIRAGAQRFNVPIEDLLFYSDIIRFSNTIGTNTIIQRDGSKVGLMVTTGREGLAPMYTEGGKSPLIFGDMVLGISEEVSTTGEIVKAPDEQLVLATAQELIDRGARCLVVAFANSEFNPTNERLVRQVVKRENPRSFLGSVPVFLSSDISRRSGVVERINAAVLNAYIHAKLVRLLYKAGEELRQRLYPKNLFIVHNNGAVARVAKTRPINTYNSGPAAGLLGARLVGQLYGVTDLISADMGGTSFDIGYVQQGQPSYSLKPDVEGFAVNVPMLAIRSIGAGGGSIASVMDGKLKVGPQSAGALPGPACFDLGGAEPTVTDADLILGILDPDYFLGGAMKLTLDKARTVVEEKIAKPLGISVEKAALAIKYRIDEVMGEEIKKLKQTTWPSDANPLLLVYGGAGPAHCCEIAWFAGIKKVIITPFSAVFSAFASSNMDVGHIYYRRVDLPLNENLNMEILVRAITDMQREAARDMRGEGFSSEKVISNLELFINHAGGEPEVKVSTDLNFFTDLAKMRGVVKQAQALLSVEGKAADGKLVLTTVSLNVQAPVPHYKIMEMPLTAGNPNQAQKSTRPVFLEATKGWQKTPVYERARLINSQQILGPGVVESEHTTVFIPLGWRLSMDRYNNILLEEVS